MSLRANSQCFQFDASHQFALQHVIVLTVVLFIEYKIIINTFLLKMESSTKIKQEDELSPDTMLVLVKFNTTNNLIRDIHVKKNAVSNCINK